MAKSKPAASGDTVAVHIPRGRANEEQNLFVSINGKNYLLPKGKTSNVPKAVANEIRRAQRAEEHMYDQRRALAAQE